MQRRLRFLLLSFVAAVLAVIAAAVPLVVQSSPPQQIQYVKVSKFDMPGLGVASMFMPKAMKPTTVTTTVGPTRERTDSGDSSEIIQCDIKRVVHLDNKDKTYYAMTFEQMQAAWQQARQNMPKAKGAAPPPAETMPPVQGSGQVSLSVTSQEDPQPQTILGMSARHLTTTVTSKISGSGQCPNMSATMKTDEWYIPNEIHFSCPLPQAPFLRANAPAGGPGGNPMAANPCFSDFQVQANDKARTTDRFALKQDTTVDFAGVRMTTHDEVTKYEKSPYDPAFFDAPAGYTQVPPPSMTGR